MIDPIIELARLLATGYLRLVIATAESARNVAVSLPETPAFSGRNPLDSGVKARPHVAGEPRHEEAR